MNLAFLFKCEVRSTEVRGRSLDRYLSGASIVVGCVEEGTAGRPRWSGRRRGTEDSEEVDDSEGGKNGVGSWTLP